MKILFASRKYDKIVGGVERMSSMLMNQMIKRGHDVGLVTFDPETATSYYPLDDKVVWKKIDIGDPLKKATWSQRFQRLSEIRSFVKAFKPDVVIGFQDGAFLTARLAVFGLGVPVIAAERNAPSRFNYLREGKFKNIKFQLFRLARFVMVQIERYCEDYPDYLRHKMRVIPNPVFPAKGSADPAGRDDEEKILLSVGRVSLQKNFMTLVRAFAHLHNDFPDWKLVIVGGGEDRPKIEDEIEKLALKDKITITGERKGVDNYYQKAHLFCLPSLWEGFPNALAEAMAFGLPSVGFHECPGVSDLIAHKTTGLLAPGADDDKNLADALRELMESPDLRVQMGAAAKESMKAYDPDSIFESWEHLFEEASGKYKK